PDAQGETLSARGFHVAGDIYVVQMWSEQAMEEGVIVVFLQVGADQVAILGIATDTQALAGQTGVLLAEDGMTLDGEPAAILAFLEAHQAGQLVSPTPVMKRAP